jgi:hypothetical protein
MVGAKARDGWLENHFYHHMNVVAIDISSMQKPSLNL